MIDTSKNGEIELFKAVSALKDLAQKNGRDNALIEEIFEEVLLEGKLEENQDFFHDKNGIKKSTTNQNKLLKIQKKNNFALTARNEFKAKKLLKK